MRSYAFPLLLALSTASGLACGGTSSEAEQDDGALTSPHAKILDFRFSAEVVTARGTEPRKAIVSQLMYAQGILTTARNGNGQVGNVKIENVEESIEGAKKRLKYTASLPVAWQGGDAPATYDLALPLDATAFSEFNAKYDGRCGSNEYGLDMFWHDWNPKAQGCQIDDADVRRAGATVQPHPAETQGKYPEYEEILKDDRLDVVAIFGIISSNTPGDYGYTQAALFRNDTTAFLQQTDLKENAPSRSILKDQTITGKVDVRGKTRDVKIDILVVEEIASIGSDFDTRYDALTEKADLVLYNGHAGLGKNVNALARKGKVTAGKYQLVLLNGCQTFAYIDTTLTDRRREANGEQDPTGTRFLDVMANALPGYANNLASMSTRLVEAVVKSDRPAHYGQIMTEMPSSHIVVVFGEEDNRFQP